MKKTLLLISLLAVTGGVLAAFLPGDPAKGKAIHDQQCVACHDSSVYTRPNRMVKSVEGLIGRVNFCNRQLNKKLTDEQVNDIINYLDKQYYHFP